MGPFLSAGWRQDGVLRGRPMTDDGATEREAARKIEQQRPSRVVI